MAPVRSCSLETRDRYNLPTEFGGAASLVASTVTSLTPNPQGEERFCLTSVLPPRRSSELSPHADLVAM
ncbi:hypothetical protein HPP92_028818 [Vanilla planifolia]|uniref:Uncharacterized protein n=1 Tax=Vanilla planifolia TaxID=51239 RepID=A0A835P603_VANPL|nr:hypothetical protein HPP92_028818 [Vanilla planifolia]KAG0446490.1 hypothetical protein HPP92_028807 [Vanilla planifolia]